jgi:hypothetical protein
MEGVALSAYYQLECETCAEVFWPVVCTKPGEMLTPDYGSPDNIASLENMESLRRFHARHGWHKLVEVEVYSSVEPTKLAGMGR